MPIQDDLRPRRSRVGLRESNVMGHSVFPLSIEVQRGSHLMNLPVDAQLETSSRGFGVHCSEIYYENPKVSRPTLATVEAADQIFVREMA